MYRSPSSPSSSVNATPSSSPIFGPVDSSPPSSPNLVPYSLDSPPRPTAFSDPFAASTKAVKRHPDYEKKVGPSPCTPPGMFTRSLGLGRNVAASRSLQEEDYANSDSPNTSPPLHRTSRYIDREERVWDDALRKPFDTGIGQIDLSNQQLKSIPASVSDLAGFFNTSELSEQCLFSGRAVLARVQTEPPVDTTRTRSFERTQSIKDSGKERHVLKLYLMGNMITSLPPELFSVRNLTVLSLRGNRLTFIPSDICLLTNLHELNVSNNRLNFLPWQMQDMKIEKLLVNPNPFLPEPSTSLPKYDPPRALLRSRRSLTRLHSLRKEALLGPTKPMLSPITLAFTRVPPLTELCLRRLLAPSDTHPSQTILGVYYSLPLSDQWSIPPNVRHILMEAVPGALRPRKRFAVDTFTREDLGISTDVGGAGMGTGRCPNPAHKGRVFVRHGSERFSWERRIAGVDVGGSVPLRWQGCLQTCLDFLDEEGATEKQGEKEREREEYAPEENDIDMELAVQPVDLAGASLDMEEFDE